jgi:hypothetical protein
MYVKKNEKNEKMKTLARRQTGQSVTLSSKVTK